MFPNKMVPDIDVLRAGRDGKGVKESKTNEKQNSKIEKIIKYGQANLNVVGDECSNDSHWQGTTRFGNRQLLLEGVYECSSSL
jgi:hypothetical protein